MRAFTSTALVRDAAPWVAGVVACACVAALGLGAGALATLAVATGAALAGASILVLARGLGSLLASGTSAVAGGRWAVVGFTLRHVVVAAATILVLRAGLPATWFLVGVTAWPLALLVAGFRTLAPARVERT